MHSRSSTAILQGLARPHPQCQHPHCEWQPSHCDASAHMAALATQTGLQHQSQCRLGGLQSCRHASQLFAPKSCSLLAPPQTHNSNPPKPNPLTPQIRQEGTGPEPRIRMANAIQSMSQMMPADQRAPLRPTHEPLNSLDSARRCIMMASARTQTEAQDVDKHGLDGDDEDPHALLDREHAQQPRPARWVRKRSGQAQDGALQGRSGAAPQAASGNGVEEHPCVLRLDAGV